MKNPVSDLRNRRKELGLTLEEVGKFVGVSKGTVSKWENGNIKNMKSDKVSLLAEILKISILDVLHMCDGHMQQGTGSDPLEEDSFVHPEDIAAMKRNTMSDGIREDKYVIMYQKNGDAVFEEFSKEDYDFLLHTIDMLKSKAKTKSDSK